MEAAVDALVVKVMNQAWQFTTDWSGLIAIPIAIASVGLLLALTVAAFRR